MRKKYIFGKKLYISILTTIVVLLTTVATTFAWVGVFANSTFEAFEFNIKASNLIEYGMEISSTGKEGTFSDSLNQYDIKRQILSNWGYNESMFLIDNDGKIENDEEKIDFYFSSLNLDQCTTTPILDGQKIKRLGKFYNLFNEETKKYFKFDIYLSVVQFYDSGQNTGDYKLDAYLCDNMLVGTYRETSLRYIYNYDSAFINPYWEMIQNNTYQLPQGISLITNESQLNVVRCNSRSAGRIAFEKYEVVEKYHPELYTSSSQPNSTKIYTGDKFDYPVYNENENIYEFGGILKNGHNFSIDYFNKTDYVFTTRQKISVPDEILNSRGPNSNTRDLVLTSKTNKIIDSSNIDEQIGTNQMMKISCYFWFEGWDADCWKGINKSPCTINISFMLKNEKEF